MTKREMFVAIREVVIDHQELVDFIDHEIGLLDKKRTTPRKPTKTQLENMALAEDIHKTLVDAGEGITMKELFEACEAIKGRDDISPQRVTHILTGLIKNGRAEREIIKKVRYYKAVM
jgi:hypothetical protein